MDVSKALDCAHVEENDLVSRYLGRKLGPEEAEAFEEHYFGCDRCWAEVQAATELRAALPAESISQKVQTPRTNWRMLAIAAAIAVAAVAGLIVSRGGLGKSPVEAVVAAAGSRRTTEARLTGGFRHMDVEPVTRGEDAQSKPWRLQKALEDAQREVERSPSAEAWRAVGIAQLLLGNHDQALDTLKKAAGKYPSDARILSDLAAVYLARFEVLGQATDLENGYEAAASAVKLDPSLPEAHFNKALILEKLGHRGTAAEEWKLYLKLERDKSWASEAARHAHGLSGRPLSELWPRDKERLREAASRGDRRTVSEVVGRFPEKSRQYIEDEVLPQWAEQRSDSSTALTIAREVAEVFRAEHSDSLLADSVALIDGSLTRGSPSGNLTRLAEGHRLYGVARRCYKEPAIEEARHLYGQAEDLLDSVGSPFRDLAIVEGVTCLFYENRPLRILDAVAPVAIRARRPYPQLFASAQWLAGLAHITLGHPTEALRAYSEALAAFQRVRDPENVGSVHYLIEEVYEDLGEFGLAAQHRRQALSTLTQTGDLPRLYVAFQLAGTAAEHAHLPELARLAYAGAVASARGVPNPDLVAHALVASAQAEYVFGDRGLAGHRLREAHVACGAIQDPSLKARALAEMSVVAGRVMATEDSERAFRELADAATFFEGKGDRSRVAAIRFERGKLYLAARRRHQAEQDFEAAIGIVELLRKAIPNEDARVDFFESTQDLFDLAISVFASDAQVLRAAEIVEQARARALLDLVQKAIPAYTDVHLYASPLGDAEIRRRLPLLTTIVQFACLEDRLLVFTLSRAGVRLTTVPVSAARLEDLTQSFVEALSQRGTSEKAGAAASAALYQLLIAPVRSEFGSATTLIFVPDKSLHRVPFAALQPPGGGRYLVEEFNIGVSPSATIYVRSLERYRSLKTAQVDRVLIVANPRVDEKLLPGLRPLVGAEGEAHAVEKLYGSSVILSGADATRSRFVEEAAAASVIHFAIHAVVESNSILSKLVLAPDQSHSDSGLLYAHEIPALRLPQARLVILSACQTLGGPARSGEGVASVARAFLAAGVPIVLGTLTPVEDRVAASLLTAFHESLSKGRDPVSALRSAQLSLIRGPDFALRSPSKWAAFELIGGALSS